MKHSDLCIVLAVGVLAVSTISPNARAEEASDLKGVLDKLANIERQNQQLAAEVRALRDEVRALRESQPAATASPAQSTAAAADVPPKAPLDDTVEVNSSRIAELAQTKVESASKMPLKITGMALFNTFLNGKGAGTLEEPLVSTPGAAANAGGTMRQSVIGLQFNGPRIFAGGTVNGSVYMDFFAGSSASLNHLVRLRVATVELDWKNRSFAVGQDKPIISPREPNSLAQVGWSPLTAAGNLWIWQPQARYEERLRFGQNSGVRAQVGVFQTSETSASAPTEYAGTLSTARPAFQGRFELWHQWGDNRRIEIAPGIHRSTTHVAGYSIPSEVNSVDWLISVIPRVDFTGMYFKGQNLANLGALRQGFTVSDNEYFIPVHSEGGWAQIAIRATERLAFHLYGGQQNDRSADLLAGEIPKNQAYMANAMYRLGTNVTVALEGGQIRTRYLGSGTRVTNHYDLALAYLF